MGHLAVTGYFLLAWGPALVFVSARVANRAFLVVLTFTRSALYLILFLAPCRALWCNLSDPHACHSCSLWILCALVVSAPSSCKQTSANLFSFFSRIWQRRRNSDNFGIYCAAIFPLDTRVEYISTLLIYAASHEVCRRVALNLQK